jgi:hypothetical protein
MAPHPPPITRPTIKGQGVPEIEGRVRSSVWATKGARKPIPNRKVRFRKIRGRRRPKQIPF